MSLSIKPIGGLGQIGSNMMEVITKDGTSIIIDCGILFPYEDTFNINYLIPNLDAVSEPSFIIITHGHEDHIGALPHLLEKFPGKTVYAPPFAAELIRNKCDYYPRKLKYKLVSDIDAPIEVENISFHYIQVNHSIPDTYGILIKEESKKALFYISDFKVDHDVEHEPVFEFEKLDKLTSDIKEKVLLADSTNITSSQGRTTSETELKPAFNKYLGLSNRRVFLTTFSSNIHRLKNLIEIGQKQNRKVVVYGRSMQNYISSAQKVGILKEDLNLYDVEQVDRKKDRLLVIISGCQCDFRSTFRRVAYGQDSHFKPTEDDLFLMSSKAIPGNEKKISLCLNEISRVGAQIVTNRDDLIHASGHAGKDDLFEVLEKFQPHFFIPIHGETFFLKRHHDWAKEKVRGLKTILLNNQDCLELENKNITPGTEDYPPIIIQGSAKLVTRESIKERRKIAEGGAVFISVCHNKSKVLGIETSFHGLDQIEKEIPEGQKSHFEKNIERIVQKNFSNKKDFSEEVRIQSRRLVKDLIGLKPVVKVIVHALK